VIVLSAADAVDTKPAATSAVLARRSVRKLDVVLVMSSSFREIGVITEMLCGLAISDPGGVGK
jgi:hypothetical protein